jgi:hypothetical protein
MSFVDIGASHGVKSEMLRASPLFCPWHSLLLGINCEISVGMPKIKVVAHQLQHIAEPLT